MAINCAGAQGGGLIKKRREKKESSWVKLKALPTNVGRAGRPNNALILSNLRE